MVLSSSTLSAEVSEMATTLKVLPLIISGFCPNDISVDEAGTVAARKAAPVVFFRKLRLSVVIVLKFE
jgi:hypothetical protein